MQATADDPKAPEALPLCDIIMQGGVTSGVVYPMAAVTLSRKFRLKNIGGTSVGALAAAVTAAAELGRLRDPVGNHGYQRLAGLTKELGASGFSRNGVTRLFDLFQPQRTTRALFGVLTAGLNRKSKLAAFMYSALAAIRHHGLAFSVAVAIILGIEAKAGNGGLCDWLLVVVLSSVVGVVVVAIALWISVTGPFVANGFGICTGYLADPDATALPKRGREPLTLWLSRMINGCAGLDEEGAPLTFGMLWHPQDPRAAPPAWLPKDGMRPWRYIDLQMISTNVTHGRPYRFPVEDEDQALFFDPIELRRWFPENVVKHLVDYAEPYSANSAQGKPVLPSGLLKLPKAKDLPVVFAARLSLSFPILLSAVPLYAIEDGRQTAPTSVFRKCWFSDGGICSNFPIHFFDAPLPLWPTFGINLEDEREDAPIIDLSIGAAGHVVKPSQLSDNRFYFPADNAAGRSDTFGDFDEAKDGKGRLFGFLLAILSSARFWQDDMLMRAPAVRDRVVRVYLKADEGGLNLDMPKKVLETLSAAGERAASMLVERFEPGSTDPMNFDNHRWVRLRSLTRVVEADMSSTHIATSTQLPPGTAPIRNLFDTCGAKTGREWYGATGGQAAKMRVLLDELESLSRAAANGGHLLKPDSPLRSPVLRIVPDV